MRKIFSLVGAAAFVASLAVPAFAADTVKGKVIDSVCYGKMGAKASSAGHAACNLKCAKNGNTMAILTSDGTVYNITGDYAANKNEKLIEFVNKDVTAEGTVSDEGGKKTIEATSITAAGTNR
jgi:hypothetical protein